MKKNIAKLIGAVLSASIIAGSIAVNSFADEWIQGWTGKAGSVNYTFSPIGDNGVCIENTKMNNGKFTDEEDTIIYYAKEIDSEVDFTLTADVSIDSYSVGDEASNPHQGSVGIGVIDDLYNKTDETAFTTGAFLGTWAKNKTDELAFYAITRNENAQTKDISEALSDTFSNSGENLGTFKLTISKVGNTYSFKCGDNTYVKDVNGMSDKIYPCLYIARNAKATFTNIEYKTETRKIKSIEVNGTPKESYVYGQELDLSDVEVKALYDDGTSEVINDYSVKGYDSKKLGQQNVKLEKGNGSYSFTVNVVPVECTEISIEKPVRTVYYNGMGLDLTGFSAQAKYNDGTSEVLSADDCVFKINSNVIKEGDIFTAGIKNITVSRKEETGLSAGTAKANFNINVKKDGTKSIEITQLPQKTSYYTGEEIDLKGIRITAQRDDGVKELISLDDCIISGFDSDTAGEKNVTLTYKYDNTKTAFFKINVADKTAKKIVLSQYPRTTFAVGEQFSDEGMEVCVEYDNGEKIPTTDYTVDTSSFNSSAEGKTSVVIKSPQFDSIKLDVTIKNEPEHKWRKGIFGQSSPLTNEESGQAGVTADNYGTVEGNINVKAWGATGKITADHDGIVYYYTRVDANNNFTVSADITVKGYLEHDNDDTKRNGQEAFGIMARDIVPLLDENDELTINYSDAKKDSEGVAVTREKSIVFASNMVMVGGYSGTGWPNNPESSTYEAKKNINRINLLARTGVTAIDGGGTRTEPAPLSSDFPKEGNKYRITLSKLNGGFYAKCYNYQTDETKEQYLYDDTILSIQNKDDMYVGFFGARWADIDVSNVEFYETDKETSQTIQDSSGKKYTPNIKINSAKYSKTGSYELELEPQDSKGTAVVRVNDKVVAQDIAVEGITKINVALDKNAENEISVLYTPDDRLNLTSYENIVVRQTVMHKDFNEKTENIYVSPIGTSDGDGTSEKPYDIDTAVGFISPGQTIIMKGGVYKRDSILQITQSNSGEEGKLKTIKAEDGQRAVFDLDGKTAGAEISGDYWHLKGIDFTNSGDNLKAVHLGGSNCIIEDCRFYNNGDMGLQISRTYQGDDFNTWPSNNLILSCESYNNCDPSMINADGFGAKLTVGEGNVFRYCKSHHNVDDGWDLYTKVNSGAIGAVTLENCVSYRNGYRLLDDGTEEPYGSGGHNGFKLGGENVAVNHIVRNCVSYGNEANGITTNSNPNLTLENVVSYDNEDANFRLYSDKPDEYNYTVSNCISYNCGKDESDILGTANYHMEYSNHSQKSMMASDNYFITQIDGESKNSEGKRISEDDVKAAAQSIISTIE